MRRRADNIAKKLESKGYNVQTEGGYYMVEICGGTIRWKGSPYLDVDNIFWLSKTDSTKTFFDSVEDALFVFNQQERLNEKVSDN